MPETVINTMKHASIKIIHSFLVLYTNCRRPHLSRGVIPQMMMMINNIEGLVLDCDLDPNHDVDDEKPDKSGTKRKMSQLFKTCGMQSTG